MSAILYIGIFTSLAAFLCWNKAIAIIGPVRSGVVYNSLPLFSGLLVWVFLQEKVGLVHWCSGVLIIGSIVPANRSSR